MKAPIKTLKLKNGLELYLVDKPGARVADVRLCFDAGFKHFTPKTFHVPHLLEHLLLSNGSDQGSEEAFISALQRLGAQSNASTDYSTVTVMLRSPNAALQQTLSMVVHSVFDMQLTEALLEKEKEIVLREIHEQYDGLDNTVANYLFHCALGGINPEAWDEHLANVPLLQVSDVQSAYETYIRPSNLKVVVAGDTKKILAAGVESILAELANTAAPSPAPAKLKPKPAQLLPLHLPMGNNSLLTYFFVSKRAQNETIRERAAFNIANMLLFESPSAVVPLELREKGIVYSIATDVVTVDDTQIFMINAMTSAPKAHIATLDILKHIQTYANGALTKAGLQDMQDFAIPLIDSSTETVEDTLEWYLSDILAERKPNTPEDEIEAVRSLSVADVTKATQTIFSKAKLYGAIASSDAAFWVDDLNKDWQELKKQTTEDDIASFTKAATEKVAAKRQEAPERAGYVWATFYGLGYVSLLCCLFVPFLPHPDNSGFITLSSFTFDFNALWGTLLFLPLVLAGATGYVSGPRTWLAERIGILLFFISSATYWYGFFRYFNGFSSFPGLAWQSIPWVIATVFFACCIPAFLSVLRLTWYDRFRTR